MDKWWNKRSTSGWRALVEVESQDLEDDLQRATTDGGTLSKEDADVAKSGLAAARKAAGPSGGFLERALEWWSGTRIEKAWGELHRVQGALLMLGPETWLRAQIPRIERSLSYGLDAGDEQLAQLRKRLTALGGPGAAIGTAREELRQIRRIANTTSDQRHREIRALRNLLTAMTALLTLALVVIGIVQLAKPGFISLCASPSTTTSDVCVNGGTSQLRGDLIEVEVIGAVAGLLAGVFAVWKMTRLPEPYGLPAAQILLKAPAGATAAIVGILLLQSNILVGLSAQPGSHMLGYAALFGFSQQLLTGLVDRKAKDLLSG